jgi:primary-amine oxidase
MSLQHSTSLPVRTSKTTVSHPLAPLSAQEIQEASSLIRNQWPEKTDLQFKVLTLEEPAKAEMVPFLEAEFKGQSTSSIDRRVSIAYYIRKTVSNPPS